MVPAAGRSAPRTVCSSSSLLVPEEQAEPGLDPSTMRSASPCPIALRPGNPTESVTSPHPRSSGGAARSAGPAWPVTAVLPQPPLRVLPRKSLSRGPDQGAVHRTSPTDPISTRRPRTPGPPRGLHLCPPPSDCRPAPAAFSTICATFSGIMAGRGVGTIRVPKIAVRSTAAHPRRPRVRGTCGHQDARGHAPAHSVNRLGGDVSAGFPRARGGRSFKSPPWLPGHPAGDSPGRPLRGRPPPADPSAGGTSIMATARSDNPRGDLRRVGRLPFAVLSGAPMPAELPMS